MQTGDKFCLEDPQLVFFLMTEADKTSGQDRTHRWGSAREEGLEKSFIHDFSIMC